VIAVVSGAACADATAPMHSVDGVWRGTAGDESVTLSLTMHGDQSVTGYGYDSSASAGATAFPVRGTVSGPTVVLLFDPATVKAGFSGQFSNAETLHGSVDLAHFSGDVQLSRISSTPAPTG
jgi:hypothetical protein